MIRSQSEVLADRVHPEVGPLGKSRAKLGGSTPVRHHAVGGVARSEEDSTNDVNGRNRAACVPSRRARTAFMSIRQVELLQERRIARVVVEAVQ